MASDGIFTVLSWEASMDLATASSSGLPATSASEHRRLASSCCRRSTLAMPLSWNEVETTLAVMAS